MKTMMAITKLMQDKLAILSILTPLVFLTGCCGTNANMDMLKARANGNIEISYKISGDELNQILSSHFGKVNVRLGDKEYALPDNGKVVELSNSSNCGAFSDDLARPAGWDCDDYVIAAMVPLRNYAFGAMYIKTASGDRHAINVFVNRNKEVVYWEPQSCEYYHGKFHKPDLIVF